MNLSTSKYAPGKDAKIYRWGVLGMLALILSLGVSGRAMADCVPFPQIALWSELTHEFVRQHVDDRYGGDWEAYLASLDRYGSKLKDIREKGLRARVTWRDKKVRLKGAKLADFLKLFEQRLAVTRCLAVNQSLTGFSPATGGIDDSDRMGSRENTRCGPIPQVAWWTFKTHESITRYIARRYRGKWDAYIDKWSRRLAKMTEIYIRGSSVKTPKGIVLKDQDLFSYINQIQKRNSVVRCLATKRQ